VRNYIKNNCFFKKYFLTIIKIPSTGKQGNWNSEANYFAVVEVGTGFMPLAAKLGWVNISKNEKW